MDGRMRAADLFAQGYAIASYDIVNQTRTWRYQDEVIELPMAVLWPEDIPNTNFTGARIEKVRDAATKCGGKCADSGSYTHLTTIGSGHG